MIHHLEKLESKFERKHFETVIRNRRALKNAYDNRVKAMKKP